MAKKKATLKKKVSLGEVSVNGYEEEITAVFAVVRDDRETALFMTDRGKICLRTRSALRENDFNRVEHSSAYTPDTFALLYETIILGCKYFKIDIDEQLKRIHSGDGGNIRVEYAGMGEIDFLKKTAEGEVK